MTILTTCWLMDPFSALLAPSWCYFGVDSRNSPRTHTPTYLLSFLPTHTYPLSCQAIPTNQPTDLLTYGFPKKRVPFHTNHQRCRWDSRSAKNEPTIRDIVLMMMGLHVFLKNRNMDDGTGESPIKKYGRTADTDSSPSISVHPLRVIM